MTFSGGKIHSNSDIYVGSNATLSLDSQITSAGNIYYRRKDDGSVPSGTVRIKDGAGNYQPMKKTVKFWIAKVLIGLQRPQAGGMEMLKARTWE